MLPQKLGLDVIVEKDAGKLVTVEINGENSGYQGLAALGHDLSGRIIEIVGDHLRGQRVLVYPDFSALHFSSGTIKRLVEYFGLNMGFSPQLIGAVTKAEFETRFGLSLDKFGALLGFGGYILDSGLDDRMINSPAVQLVTEDKLLQYELLKGVPELNVPETWFLGGESHPQKLIELQCREGRLVKKERYGSQGRGMAVIDGKVTAGIKSPDAKEAVLGVFKAFGYLGIEIGDESYKFILDLHSSGNRETVVNLLVSAFKAAELANRRLESVGVLVQKFVETKPVIYEKTGQPHFACASTLTT